MLDKYLVNQAPSRFRALLRPKIIATALVVVALIVAARHFGAGDALVRVLDWIAGLGPVAPLAFIAIYILACVLFVPGSILSIGAGAVFGLFWGAIYVSIGATLGASAAFLVGRYLARDWVARKIESNPRFKAIDDAVAREGWKIVGLTRLSPVFPFNLLNYAYGLTRVSLRDYFLASWIGMIPGILLYVYIGSLGGDLARVAAMGPGAMERPAAAWLVNALGFVATVLLVIYVTRIGARALREKT